MVYLKGQPLLAVALDGSTTIEAARMPGCKKPETWLNRLNRALERGYNEPVMRFATAEEVASYIGENE